VTPECEEEMSIRIPVFPARRAFSRCWFSERFHANIPPFSEEIKRSKQRKRKDMPEDVGKSAGNISGNA
jgi:hypothetical protein